MHCCCVQRLSIVTPLPLLLLLLLLPSHLPLLLSPHFSTISGKVSHLQTILQIPEDKAISLVRQYPQLLSRSTDGLSRPLICLQQIPADSVLAPAAAQAAQVCLQRPALLSLAGESREDSLSARLLLLQDLAGISPGWRARVAELVVPAGQLAAAQADGGQVDAEPSSSLAKTQNPEPSTSASSLKPKPWVSRLQLADVLIHRDMWQRLSWVLQQERSNKQQRFQQQYGRQHQQQVVQEPLEGQSAAGGGQGDAPSILSLLMVPVEKFEQRYGGFSAWVREQQAAAAVRQGQVQSDTDSEADSR